MIADLKPYAEYKESGLPWLGQVPAHWETRVMKRLCSRSALYGANIPAADYVSGGVRFLRTTDITDEGTLRCGGVFVAEAAAHDYMLADGDLLLSRSGTIGRSLRYRTEVHGPCAYAGYLVRFVPKPIASSDYLFHFTKSLAFADFIRVSAVSSTIENVNGDKYANMPVTLPPLDEQAAIVRFLDWANGRLERAIRAKRKVIALLNEQKQAIIHRAVTRGLDPSVPLKPSGIPWLGDIPQHWEVRRAKQLCTAIIDCKNRTPEMVDGGEFVVVRTTNIRHGVFNPKGSYSTDRRNFDIWTQRGAPKFGDVFFTREAPVGEACHVPDQQNLCMGQRMMYFRADTAVLDSDFLLNSIYGPVVRRYVEIETNGSTVGHLRLGQVSALPLLWCSIDEQKEIVAYIAAQSAPLEVAISRLEREIELLREYRTRLVADVVTGKVDVREAAARLPIEAPLDTIEDDADPDDEAEADDEDAGQ